MFLSRTGLRCLSVCVSLAASTVANAQPPVSHSPVQRERAIDVEHLSLDLRFDIAKKEARGTSSITLSLLRPATTVALDGAGLTISSIALPNGAPLKFTHDGSDRDGALIVNLDRLYGSREQVTLSIGYTTTWVNEADPNNLAGSNGAGLRFFAPTATEPIKRRQIWSMGEPFGNRYWFPSYDAPDDLRTTDIKVTIEKPFTAVSNGVLLSTMSNTDGTRTFHWKADTPHANQFTTLVIGDYVDVSQDWDGISLHSYSYPDEREATAASVVRLPDMMRFYSDVTGVRYPFKSYSQAFVQDLAWGVSGMGTATLTENMVDDEPTHADYRYLWDGLSAETLARQWFGVQVTPRDWRDTWLDRGLSHYFDGLYNEFRNGRDEFLLWHIQGDYNFYFADWKGGTRFPVVATGDEKPTEFATSNYPSVRGGLVMHMLRKHVGEEVFARAIKRYVGVNTGRTVTTYDLQRAFEDASGELLGWFFDQWVKKAGHPIFEVSKNYDASKKELTLVVKQTQTLDPKATYPQAEFFAGMLDIAIDDRVERVWLEAKPVNTFTFAQAALPKIVHFDHENTWVKELTFPKPLDELLYQAQNDRDMTGRRWAISELVNVAKDAKTSAADKERIRAALRNVASSDTFWRIKMNALSQLTGLLAPASAGQPVTLDRGTVETLQGIIKNERSPWVRTAALGTLALSRDPRFADLYISLLRDVSHPVSYAAATALGQTKSPKAFRALVDIMKVPSWKGENVLSGLVGLKELGDVRAADVALAVVKDQTSRRWTLATPRWDFRIAAAETLVAIGKGATAFPVVLDRFAKSLAENDVNDVFSNVLLMATLGDPRGLDVFEPLRTRFKGNENALAAVNAYETQLKEALASRPAR